MPVKKRDKGKFPGRIPIPKPGHDHKDKSKYSRKDKHVKPIKE